MSLFCLNYFASTHPLNSLQSLYFSIQALEKSKILCTDQLLHVLTAHCGHEIAIPASHLAPFQTFVVEEALLKRTALIVVFFSHLTFSPLVSLYRERFPFFSRLELQPTWTHRGYIVLPDEVLPTAPPPTLRNGVAGSFFSPHVYLHGFQSLSVPLLLHFLNNWSAIMNHWEAYSRVEKGKVCSPNMTGTPAIGWPR